MYTDSVETRALEISENTIEKEPDLEEAGVPTVS
jgi:hypothetical protein